MDLFADYFIKKKMSLWNDKFFARLQSADESIAEYVADLKNKSMSYEFDEFQESFIKYVLIFGMHTKWLHIKQSILSEERTKIRKGI